MNWTKNEAGDLQITVPIEVWPGQVGEYIIHIVPRPSYCDRGDWNIMVDGFNDLDYSDGFPRYFFGTEDEVKQQMETWINKRAAYRNFQKKNQSS